jgi:hypothetical protein
VSLEGPLLLTADHVVDELNSGTPPLDNWLRLRALNNQHGGASRSWVVVDDTSRVVAFYASATSAILRSRGHQPGARNQPDELPAILLARLAVDIDHHGRGLGADLLKHFIVKAIEVSELGGVHVVLVHAKEN